MLLGTKIILKTEKVGAAVLLLDEKYPYSSLWDYLLDGTLYYD